MLIEILAHDCEEAEPKELTDNQSIRSIVITKVSEKGLWTELDAKFVEEIIEDANRMVYLFGKKKIVEYLDEFLEFINTKDNICHGFHD